MSAGYYYRNVPNWVFAQAISGYLIKLAALILLARN